jgi:hypothetical protein
MHTTDDGGPAKDKKGHIRCRDFKRVQDETTGARYF